MAAIFFIAGIALMFFVVWGALTKPRTYEGIEGRLFFTWHVLQFASVFCLLVSGSLFGGASFDNAVAFLGRWPFWIAVVIAGTIYIVLMRVWPKRVRPPKWL